MNDSKKKADVRKADDAPAPAGRVSTRTLVAVAGVAVALAVALFGFQAGWFTSSDDEAPDWGEMQSAREQATQQKVASAAGGVVQASWDPLPEGAPVAGVGPAAGPDAPSQISIPVDNGRGAAGVRLPRNRPTGAHYTAISVELRSGNQRVWGTYLPIRGTKEEFAVMALSFDAAAMRAGKVDTSAMTLVVSGVSLEDRRRQKSDTIGEVRLSLQ